MSDLSTHDVSAIRDASSSVGKAATGATSTVTSTVSEIKGIGVAWGADEAGAAFAGVYLDPAQQALTAVVQVGHQLDRISATLQNAADGHEETEQVNADTSNALLRNDQPPPTDAPTRTV
ncbi:MAG: WXG100 family type VII secretion target [Propionibacteriaceae bacterium]